MKESTYGWSTNGTGGESKQISITGSVTGIWESWLLPAGEAKYRLFAHHRLTKKIRAENAWRLHEKENGREEENSHRHCSSSSLVSRLRLLLSAFCGKTKMWLRRR
jgi:hypothetical protein